MTQLKFKATGDAPEYYSFEGDIVTAYYDSFSESFDLSDLAQGDKFEGLTVETLELSDTHIIRDTHRDSNDALNVTLCQAVGPGHWQESDWFDSTNYDPDAIHVAYQDKPHSGEPWAITKQGKVNPNG